MINFAVILVKRSHMMRYLPRFFAVAVVFALCSCGESLEDKSAREVREYTKDKCPARVSEYLIIDSVTFEKSTHTVTYHYTFDGKADNAKLVASIDMREKIVSEVKNSTSLRKYKDEGYAFAYIYHSASDTALILFQTTVTKEDYK